MSALQYGHEVQVHAQLTLLVETEEALARIDDGAVE